MLSVDRDRHLLTVEAGMTLRELALAAEAHDMSVPAGALPLYGNLTVGGVVLTSAHGTAYRTTSSLGDLLRKVNSSFTNVLP
jgi:L-gulonolactone oxidase